MDFIARRMIQVCGLISNKDVEFGTLGMIDVSDAKKLPRYPRLARR